MNLTKYCSKMNNIERGAKLRIGTLYTYHNIETTELQDAGEGMHQFSIAFEGEVSLPIDVANLLLSGAMEFGSSQNTPRIPGSFKAHIENIHVIKNDSTHVRVKDTKITIDRVVPNCLIFCMSKTIDGQPNPFSRYDDSWSIPIETANKFGMRVAKLLLEKVPLSELCPDAPQYNSANSIKSLGLNLRSGEVIYRDRSIIVSDHSELTMDQFIKVVIDIPFCKPISYAKEREYRFVFEVTDGERLFSPKDKYIDIDLNPIFSQF